jgi:hypothetical protein
MAKASVKAPTEKAPVKKAPAKKAALSIETISEEILSKLKSLQFDTQLQSDIEWCLGSYRHDQNPVGLYETAERALALLKEEHAKKTKGVTAKIITDIETVLKDR